MCELNVTGGANIHRVRTTTLIRNIIMFQFLQKPFSNRLFTIYIIKTKLTIATKSARILMRIIYGTIK